MIRKISKNLIEWKDSKNRKPLILQGARQVGKTFSLLDFAKKHYDNVAYINFETQPLHIDAFSGDISPEYLIPLLSRLSGTSISKGKTLIILDEVQLCERALTSLKYFCELAPEYHIIACGSLLGVAVNREEFSFPVGKVDIFTLYPMDFEEFLLAFQEMELVNKIHECFNTNMEMSVVYHNILLEFYRKYLVVGGMPEVVSKFIETTDYIFIRHLQEMILTGYLDDMSKYNRTNEIQRTRLVYDSVTVQLSKTNTKFQYKLVKKGGRASELENAIEWLELAGIVNKCYKVEKIAKPLENYKDIDSFKVYISDVGLLAAKKKIKAEDILYMIPGLNDFKGGMTENYVCNQLAANGYSKYFWESGAQAEIDFVILRDNEIIPIEVKSADNTQAKSLNVYIKKYNPKYAIKISTKNFGFEDGKKSIPLYAAFCL